MPSSASSSRSRQPRETRRGSPWPSTPMSSRRGEGQSGSTGTQPWLTSLATGTPPSAMRGLADLLLLLLPLAQRYSPQAKNRIESFVIGDDGRIQREGRCCHETVEEGQVIL